MPISTTASELDRLIPPEVKDDPFYRAILSLAQTQRLKTVLEIGSSSGEGSTEAFVLGLRKNPHQPTLFCMELSKPRYEAASTVLFAALQSAVLVAANSTYRR